MPSPISNVFLFPTTLDLIFKHIERVSRDLFNVTILLYTQFKIFVKPTLWQKLQLPGSSREMFGFLHLWTKLAQTP